MVTRYKMRKRIEEWLLVPCRPEERSQEDEIQRLPPGLVEALH